MPNPYDGKAFLISTPDSSHVGAGYLAPADGSIKPLRIIGAEHGSRYTLDTGTGRIEDSIQGPWVGAEIDEFLAKRGGVTGRLNGGDVAPWPGWVLAQFLAPLDTPVQGGPNAAPDKAPDYKQVGSTIVPVATSEARPAPEPTAPASALPPAAIGTLSSVPAPSSVVASGAATQGQNLAAQAPQPAAPVAVTQRHLSLLQRIEKMVAQLRAELGG